MTCLNLKRKALILEGEYGMHDKKALENLIFSKTIQKNHTSLTLRSCYDILSVKISVRAYNNFSVDRQHSTPGIGRRYLK